MARPSRAATTCVRGGSLVAWEQPRAPRADRCRSGSSAPTPTARTCGSSRTRTPAARAGASSASRSTAARCSTPGSTVTSASPAGSRCARTAARRRACVAGRPAAAARAAAGHPPRPRGQHQRAAAQPAAAPGRGLGRRRPAPSAFAGFLAERARRRRRRRPRLGPDDSTTSHPARARSGATSELVSAPRLDNQCSCFAGLRRPLLAGRPATPRDRSRCPVLALFDHEEVGSDLGPRRRRRRCCLDRRSSGSCVGRGGGPGRPASGRSPARSCASGRHGPRHAPQLRRPARARSTGSRVNGGPVLKVQRRTCATPPTRAGAAAFALALRAGRRAAAALRAPRRPALRLHHRPDHRGAAWASPPSTSAPPQLAMHSARELCGAEDPAMYVASLAAFLSPA